MDGFVAAEERGRIILHHLGRGQEGCLFLRRKLPALRLTRKHYTAFGQGVALIWQVVLLVGPCAVAIYSALDRIRSLTTDMGAETHVRDAADFVQEFLAFPGARVPRCIEKRTFLLRNCVRLSGWKHKVDI